jgi:hypothetical protein
MMLLWIASYFRHASLVYERVFPDTAAGGKRSVEITVGISCSRLLVARAESWTDDPRASSAWRGGHHFDGGSVPAPAGCTTLSRQVFGVDAQDSTTSGTVPIPDVTEDERNRMMAKAGQALLDRGIPATMAGMIAATTGMFDTTIHQRLQHIFVPLPMLMLVFAIPPLFLARSSWLRYRASHRSARGLCANCGYDIRGSDRCPECGVATRPSG